jgi:hypothetical protein
MRNSLGGIFARFAPVSLFASQICGLCLTPVAAPPINNHSFKPHP